MEEMTSKATGKVNFQSFQHIFGLTMLSKKRSSLWFSIPFRTFFDFWKCNWRTTFEIKKNAFAGKLGSMFNNYNSIWSVLCVGLLLKTEFIALVVETSWAKWGTVKLHFRTHQITLRVLFRALTNISPLLKIFRGEDNWWVWSLF
jgi:type IV secretory pathway TraG/TraD family ATPase VirD4